MTNYREIWDEKHYRFSNYRELRGVDWNCNELRGKSNIMLTFVVIVMWACLCLFAF